MIPSAKEWKMLVLFEKMPQYAARLVPFGRNTAIF
jgi:hypothetical protein